ncbi:hypothetical protein CEXT_152521 [Caerostris extrusa]|uniref:Uncharacterized protein n=1 Tax=Caerostris extrusa TaxID=172846 RepID=A0AAV4Q641_CAEEX|nr:hypothetical protein CEXT_152521 [Caerostris extrusa]
MQQLKSKPPFQATANRIPNVIQGWGWVERKRTKRMRGWFSGFLCEPHTQTTFRGGKGLREKNKRMRGWFSSFLWFERIACDAGLTFITSFSVSEPHTKRHSGGLREKNKKDERVVQWFPVGRKESPAMPG